jgi:hypothetical protein
MMDVLRSFFELVLMFIIHNYMYSKYIFPTFPNPKNCLTKYISHCVPWVENDNTSINALTLFPQGNMY